MGTDRDDLCHCRQGLYSFNRKGPCGCTDHTKLKAGRSERKHSARMNDALKNTIAEECALAEVTALAPEIVTTLLESNGEVHIP